jgi:hypothetical protein
LHIFYNTNKEQAASKATQQPTMKTGLTIIPLTIIVALALTCNSYATPPAGRKISTSRHVGSVHGEVYEIRRFFPVVQTLVSSELSDKTLLSTSGGDAVAKAAVAKVHSKKKVVGVTVTSLLFALIMASTASRQFIADYLLSLLASYNVSMFRSPLETKVATGVILAVLGDALAQTRGRSQNAYDPRRGASFGAFDSCYRVFQHNAFPFIISSCQGNVLGAMFSGLPGLAAGPSLRLGLAALERTLVYQLVVIPLLYYPIFFTFTGYLQGLKPQEILQRAKTSFLPCWKRNLMFWIPTQMVMFGLIDERWQIPFACVMGMLWSTILSVTAGNAKTGSSTKA